VSERLVWLDEIEFGYADERPVLAECSLEVGAGDRIGLMGPIGSGKTTLLRLIVGLVHPTAGRVEVFGQTRIDESDFRDVRQRVGYLFQDPDDQLFCPTVAEDVAFGPLNLGKPRAEVKQIVADTLEQLGLGGYEDRVAYQLSGGEKRLVALAGVLAMQPDVLLLDEPTAGLDSATADHVVAILQSLPQAMVIVSHDQTHLQQVARICWTLSEGQLQRASS
jgi:cobalt/nickel transport system ATP-binding protein